MHWWVAHVVTKATRHALRKYGTRSSRRHCGQYLHPEALPRPMEHLQRGYPLKRPGRPEDRVQPPFIAAQCGAAGYLNWCPCPLTEHINEPVWAQAINVAVPNLQLVSKNQIAKV